MTDQRTWRTSSYSSSGGNCVEIAWDPATTAVRDSKNPTAGTLTLPQTSFTALLGLINTAAD
ncbi:MAG TPA: DUF397 domain-containing protein [Pseudonocardiaceae bacterium]